MKLTIDINVNLRADDTLTALLANLLAAKAAPSPTPEPVATFLPKPERVEPVLSEHAAARMLTGPSPKPTPIPEELRRTTLHPVTQEALAKLEDADLADRIVGAVAERDRRVMASRPVSVEEITPTALAKPTRTVKPAKPSASTAERPAGYLTCEEACEAYGCHFTTLYARVKSGAVCKVKVGRSAYFSPPETSAA